MPNHSGEIVTGSFHVEQEVLIRAPRERVFEALANEVGQWWCHRLHHGPSTLHLDASIGGQFVERWEGGAGVLWGTVTCLIRPEVLRLSGPLGMQTPVNSVYQYTLEESDGGSATLVRLSHRVNGEIDRYWHEAHEQGWKDLWVTLKAWVEDGRAIGVKGRAS